MSINFKNIDYLKVGNCKQVEIYYLLKNHKLLEILKDHNPIIVGTIPIEIDIENSDVDIILETKNFESLKKLLIQNFLNYNDFKLRISGKNIIVCNFTIDRTPIEIYSENKVTDQQFSYLHMIKEYEILKSKGPDFKEKIIELKKAGLKTEEAFCKLLKISGNPYIELLHYELK